MGTRFALSIFVAFCVRTVRVCVHGCFVLCYVALRCVVLCCIVLCCVVLCYVALRCVVLCCIVFCWAPGQTGAPGFEHTLEIGLGGELGHCESNGFRKVTPVDAECLQKDPCHGEGSKTFVFLMKSNNFKQNIWFS